MSLKYLFLFCIILLTANNMTAQSSKIIKTQIYKVGGVSIIFPSPNDTLIEVGSANREKFEIFVPSQNRLICAFFQNKDIQNFTIEGAELEMTTYAYVQVSRKAEYMDCSQSDFKEVISGSQESFGDVVVSTFKESEDEINKIMKSLDLESIQIGETKQIGTLFSKKDAFSFGMLTSIKSGENKRNLIMGGVLMRIKKRLIFIYLYTEYKNEDSIKWIGTTTEKWTDAIFKENK